jgi:hypothetical protein
MASATRLEVKSTELSEIHKKDMARPAEELHVWKKVTSMLVAMRNRSTQPFNELTGVHGDT